MKIKSLVNHCKKYGVVRIYQDADGIQWLGDGHSLYPLFDMPQFTETSFCETFEITKKKREQMSIQFNEELPSTINIADIDDTEQEVFAAPNIKLAVNGSLYIPYTTQMGVRFIDADYIKPLADMMDDLQIYERMTESGTLYFAAKAGFMLRGIILPANILSKDLVDQLSVLSSQCKVAFFNEKEATGNDRN